MILPIKLSKAYKKLTVRRIIEGCEALFGLLTSQINMTTKRNFVSKLLLTIIIYYFGTFFGIFRHFPYLKLKLQYWFYMQVALLSCETITQTSVHKFASNDLDYSNKY